MQKLENEKQELTNKLNNAIKEKRTGEYKSLQTICMLERNKLQIYAMERQMSTLNIHKSTVDNAMQVELEVKASLHNSLPLPVKFGYVSTEQIKNTLTILFLLLHIINGQSKYLYLPRHLMGDNANVFNNTLVFFL